MSFISELKRRNVFRVAAAGFIVVLVFSWVFEMTPEGIKREKDKAPC
jgi:hypothetical protein